MAKSKSKMFKSLYLKDLREIRTELLVVAAVAIILVSWAYFKTEGLTRGIILLPTAFALGLAGFLPVITSFRILGKEWSNNTIYMMMSLPVSGSMMLGSKLAVLLTEYLAGTLVVLLTGGIALLSSFPDIWKAFISDPYSIKLALAVYGVSITGILFIFCNSFLSQLTGKLFKKASDLISLLVFLAVFVIAARIMTDSSILLTQSQLMLNYSMQEIGVLLIKAAIDLLFAVALFAAAVVLWERRIEL